MNGKHGMSGQRLWERHPHVRTGDELSFGERAADVMRNAFGSWAFVGAFLAFMAAWMILNTAVLGTRGFDRYPYILLNLALSMMAGLQGALILIAAKRADRVAAEQATAHYAETSKIDGMAGEVLTLQKQQLDLLAGIDHMSAELAALRTTVTAAAAAQAPAPAPADGETGGDTAPATPARTPRPARGRTSPKCRCGQSRSP